LFDLSWGTAIVGATLFAAGLGLEELAKHLARNAKRRLLIALLVWPFRVLGFLLMATAVSLMLWNMLGPVVQAILRAV
jgi:hypothetical protein